MSTEIVAAIFTGLLAAAGFGFAFMREKYRLIAFRRNEVDKALLAQNRVINELVSLLALDRVDWLKDEDSSLLSPEESAERNEILLELERTRLGRIQELNFQRIKTASELKRALEHVVMK